MRKYIKDGYEIRIEEKFYDVSTLEDIKSVGILKPKVLTGFCRTKEEIIKAVEEYFKDE